MYVFVLFLSIILLGMPAPIMFGELSRDLVFRQRNDRDVEINRDIPLKIFTEKEQIIELQYSKYDNIAIQYYTNIWFCELEHDVISDMESKRTFAFVCLLFVTIILSVFMSHHVFKNNNLYILFLFLPLYCAYFVSYSFFYIDIKNSIYKEDSTCVIGLYSFFYKRKYIPSLSCNVGLSKKNNIYYLDECSVYQCQEKTKPCGLIESNLPINPLYLMTNIADIINEPYYKMYTKAISSTLMCFGTEIIILLICYKIKRRYNIIT